MENLPLNYSRIFQFQSFDRTRRRILNEAAEDEEGAMVRKSIHLLKNNGWMGLFDSTKVFLLQVGWYVTLHIIDVPASVMESVQSGRPLTLVSLLPHEQKVRRLTRGI